MKLVSTALPSLTTRFSTNAKLLALVTASCTAAGTLRAAPSAGDRGSNPNLTFPATLLMQNGGPIIDVTQPPEPGMHAAKGDGVADDTDALQDAYDLLKRRFEAAPNGFAPEVEFYIYLPNGTYLVKDTILYRGDKVKANVDNWDICHVKFVGQNRAKTTLRLADHAPAFQDPAHPRPVLTFQHPTTAFNNGPAGNYLRDLTIDVGNGNPGAVGVMFQGANQTDMHDLTVVSEDGSGQYGIWFREGSVQGYYADITVRGFDHGIYDVVTPENSAAFEYLTLKDQRVAGITLGGGNLSLRQVLSDQSTTGVPALRYVGEGQQAVLVDSTLEGGTSKNPAVALTRDDKQSLFARDVVTTGYAAAVVIADKTAASAGEVKELVFPAEKILFDGQRTASLHLPVQDTPPLPQYDPAKDWAVVEDYPGVQEAFNSGKPVVCFKARKYQLKGDVSVPASVKVVEMLSARIEGGNLNVDQPSADPVAFQDGVCTVQVAAARDVAARCYGGRVVNDKALPVTVYLENVNDCISGDGFCPHGGKVFARCIDVEYHASPQIVCGGGSLWVFGFKTEDVKGATPMVVRNGGSLEVLGGYVNMIDSPNPGYAKRSIVTNEDSSASVTCSTNMVGLYDTAIKETRGNQTRTEPSADLPLRGGEYKKNFSIPLYVGSKTGADGDR